MFHLQLILTSLFEAFVVNLKQINCQNYKRETKYSIHSHKQCQTTTKRLKKHNDKKKIRLDNLNRKDKKENPHKKISH